MGRQVMLRVGLALMALGLGAFFCESTSVESVASKGDSREKKKDSVLTLPSAHTHAVKQFKALPAVRLYAEIDHAAEAK